MEDVNTLVRQACTQAYTYFQNNEFKKAEDLYKQILKINSDQVDSLHMLPLAMHRGGNGIEARKLAEDCLKTNCNPQMYNNLGLIVSDLGDHIEAVRCFKEALKLDPNAVFIHSNLAIEYKKNGNIVEAEKTFIEALKRHPNSEYLLFNYGTLLQENLRLKEATEVYGKAIFIDPSMSSSHYNLAICLFLNGDYKNAWKEYEWRWKQYPAFNGVRNRFTQSFWTGQDLTNKTMLLYTEQGVGDTLQFIRFIDKLKAKKVYLECREDLKTLLSSTCSVVSDELPEFDYHCSLLSLPAGLGDCDIRMKQPYVKPIGNRTEDWNKYKDLLKVGIVWAGNPVHPDDKERSCYLREFQVLAGDKVKLFSLQKDIRPRDWADLTEGANFDLVDLGPHLKDFNCTALAIQEMDVIVTVDTAVAHLAGAMNKRVIVLLASRYDWRWQVDKKDKTDWYPSMTLVRWQGSWKKSLLKARKIYE